ncbi:MAG: PEP-CTERM sorting domain-containing protein [Candidatus Omnitrophica bacterium]|nr:PEP-CTERM sorting domain-containing protein [Candidatus Omnitrophota bacterium]MCB9769839.1 PEP-CTERM sorting domain-containing protein [Candidatus Omnitrophota bacterium]
MKWYCTAFMAFLFFGCIGLDRAEANHYNNPDPWWDKDYSWCLDPYNDAAGGNLFEVYKIGHAIENGKLYVSVKTGFPIGGARGGDSYDNRTWFSPGDLYLNVGGMFQTGNGTVYGIGTTDHSGDRTSDPNDGPWETVYDGKLYIGSNFATGTYETYPTNTPSDGNNSDNMNNYPTLIMNYLTKVSGSSGFHYNDGWNYNEYFYWVDLAAIGLDVCEDGSCAGGTGLTQSLQITWAMECGNDLAECKIEACENEVPEPSTVALVGAGVLALGKRRRFRL